MTEPMQAASVDLDALRPMIEARVAEMREAFNSSPDEARQAFRAMLGPDGRLRVYPDPHKWFRVEGMLELDLENRRPRCPDWERGFAVERFREVPAPGPAVQRNPG